MWCGSNNEATRTGVVLNHCGGNSAYVAGHTEAAGELNPAVLHHEQ